MKILFVCLANDYLNQCLSGFEVETWGKPLEEYGEVKIFDYIGFLNQTVSKTNPKGNKDRLQKLLLNFCDNYKPDVIFHPTYKEYILIDTWEQLSEKYFTVAWMSDDDWRFYDFSKTYAKPFRKVMTTWELAAEEYLKVGFREDQIVKSQWAANPYHFYDRGKSKIKFCCFCGQKKDKMEVFINYANSLLPKNIPHIVPVGSRWKEGMIPFGKMAKQIRESKIGLNFADSAVGLPEMKLRPFEVTACKTLLLTEYLPGLEKYFEIGKEVLVFETKEDLAEKLLMLLEDPQKMEEIALAGYKRTMKDHLWENRLDLILKGENNDPTI